MNQWDERFSGEEYIYGKEPNEFFKTEIDKLKPGKILLPAEGEGRNAVYAASLGWDVSAFDSSVVAREKALKLAKSIGVDIEYSISGYFDFIGEKTGYDAIAFVFSHVKDFKESYLNVLRYVKPGGVVIIEGFSRNQIYKVSGGPKDIEMLFCIDDISEILKGYKVKILEETDVELSEGSHHEGEASVIRVVAIK